jgi:hypothetical protein
MKSWQWIASWALGIGLVAVTVMFSIPVHYGNAYWPIAVAESIILGLVVWFGGGRQILGADERRRRLAVAGVLLVAPFALFALLPGLGPPDSLGSVVLEQHRFTVLLVNALVIATGCSVLREHLEKEGAHLAATLGMAAASMAAPLYVVFTAIQLVDYRELERKGMTAESASFSTLDEVSIVLLFFGSALNYVAAIAFAVGFFKANLLSRRARTIHVLISATMLSFLIFRGLDYGGLPKALRHWYTTVAFFAGVPAISWVPLAALGVVALSQQRKAASSSEI